MIKKELLLLLTLFIYYPLQAQKVSLNPEVSTLRYKAKHMVHSWEGTHRKLQGLAVLKDKQLQQIAVKGAVQDFDSNNANRDSHALEVLEALQFPDVRFFASDIQSQSDAQVLLKGTLIFHGVTIEKDVLASYAPQGDGFRLLGNFDFNATDFGVTLPSFLLVKMQDKIQIEFDLHFRSFP